MADYPMIYNIEGYKTFIIPGAYSVDKLYRLRKGYPWFQSEQLTEGEMEFGLQTAKKGPFDLILSHTCPLSYEPTDLFLSVIDQTTVDKTMERYLNQIELNTQYKLWCFGHYHQTRVFPEYEGKQIIMLYDTDLLDLNQYFITKNPYESLKKI
jgi:3-oxoacid CoA-transferase subunit A